MACLLECGHGEIAVNIAIARGHALMYKAFLEINVQSALELPVSCVKGIE
ncbi:hypothetical protein CEV31_3990 [Brucella thiophenivorans]|uniref:Uncharacterized protein n=1 Tax=Brucella thiophenivorans TaxID=571255 RepID=A0A256F1F2_9HYPH|nr:hypothetical protein CEV31_3990 [Brucella thiophenivorans]